MAQKNYIEKKFTCERGGLTIRGLLFEPNNTSKANNEGKLPVAIVSHMFMVNYKMTVKYARFLAEEGYLSVCYDFNGGGLFSKSDGKSVDMSVLTEVADLEAVVQAVLKHEKADASRLTLMGCSQGGFVSAYVAAHREDIHSGFFHTGGFRSVKVVPGNLYAVPRRDMVRTLPEVDHAVRSPSAYGGVRHTVHVAAQSRLVIIPVAVRVYPDDAYLSLRFIVLRDGGYASGGDAVVATEDQRKMTFGKGLRDCFVQLLICGIDLLVTDHVTEAHAVRRRDQVALVRDTVSHHPEILGESGVTYCQRSHCNAFL